MQIRFSCEGHVRKAGSAVPATLNRGKHLDSRTEDAAGFVVKTSFGCILELEDGMQLWLNA